MKFFDDLEFVRWGGTKNCSNICRDRLFQDYYGLQFVSSGAIYLKVGDSPVVQARGPVCFFTMPGALFNYGTPEPETREHYFVCFKGERVKRYINGGLLPGDPEAVFLPSPDLKEFVPQWKSLLLRLRSSRKNSHAESVLMLERLLLEVATALPGGKGGGVSRSLVRELVQRIANSPGSAWDPEKEAERIGVSMVHFRRLFQETAGMPVWQYVIECRIRYAAQLLASSDKLVKEIASECGFNSVFHFSREFKKLMKKSPDHFRKAM